MSTGLSAEMVEQMLQGLTPQPWAYVRLHTGEPPRDLTWRDEARPVRYQAAWTADFGGTMLEVIADPGVPPGVVELRSGGRLLGTASVADFGEPGDILGRIDAALEDWERGADAMRWSPE